MFDKLAGKKISGKDAFVLFSTYGFPLELTLELAEDKGIEVDVDGFQEEMKKKHCFISTEKRQD